ncbi:MAG: phosphodiester glycosidase family protein [Candidatus Eremiobacteraeota bacterium]|nr:phosphodiester glycosidase family protein [Candidatus Eremiobacteraeota bacterium]
MRTGIATLACVLFLFVPCAAPSAPLPERIVPLMPFPRIAWQDRSTEPIAPGVTSAEYVLMTDAGPLAAFVVAIELNHKDVSIDSVLAADALTSNGETVSSMARRTNAVAGINADYFDIGNTNRPTNIVVRGGRLLRTPSKRYALVVTRSGVARIVEPGFTGTLQVGDRSVPIDALNDLPPPGGGIVMLTPEFGAVAPEDNLTLVALTPRGGAPPFTDYRVVAVADNTVRQPPGYYVAIGLNAYGGAGVPNPGDTVSVNGDMTPVAMSEIAAAVGGGPLILSDGAWYDDPDGPNGGDYSARSPSSGAAIEPDGTLLLVEVDGRQPERSVGVTRREFAALMRALGARQGIAFDGGGSSAMAVRELGTRESQLHNHPSDGVERPVGDGIFVYSSAPVGAPITIVARPREVLALPGGSVNIRATAVDENDHLVAPPATIAAHVEPSSLGTYLQGKFSAVHPGIGAIVFRSGALQTRLPVDVFAGPSRLEILPDHPNVPENGHVRLSARAFDKRGAPIAMPDQLPWRTDEGHIAENGILDATSHDSAVSLTIGAAFAVKRVTVGSHQVGLSIEGAHFLTVPRGGDGDVSQGSDGLELRYALGPSERAAYISTDLALPPGTIALSFDVRDDASGAKLRLSLRNAANEQILVTATELDRHAWRHLTIALPQSIGQSARLSSLYVIGTNASARTSGSIAVRGLTATVAGSP